MVFLDRFIRLDIFNKISDEIVDKLVFPLKNNLEIFTISKLISEKLEIFEQICLVNLLQYLWWRNTGNVKIVEKLEILKKHIGNNVQSRLAWEISLLKIGIEDF